MIRQLPRWVWGGGGLLAFNAGIINVVGLLGLEHQAVTHLTGTTSMLGEAIARLSPTAAFHLLAVIGSFVAGALLSGFIIADSTLRLGRRYGVALFLESLLLCAAVSLLSRYQAAGLYFASCASGLQNAMASTYSGSVIRTSHLSGMFTDIGILLGQAARGMPGDPLRLRLYAVIISGFLLGGVAGALGFARLGYDTLYFPAGLAGLASLLYVVYDVRYRYR